MRVRIKFYAKHMQVARVMQNKSSDRGGGRDKTETCLSDSPQSICLQRLPNCNFTIKTMKDGCTWAVREVMRELGNEGRVLEASAW